MNIRIFLVEDHALVRMALQALLDAEPGFETVGAAGSGEEALPSIRACAPDVVVCDLYLPGMSGMEVTERIVGGDPAGRVVIVSALEDGPLPQRLLDLGASAYVGKGAASEELCQAVRLAAKGERYLDPVMAQKLAFSGLHGGSTPFDALSAREMQVAMLLARGVRQEDAAKVLDISPKTVNSHKANLFDKLCVRDTIALARLAAQHGLLDPAEALEWSAIEQAPEGAGERARGEGGPPARLTRAARPAGARRRGRPG